MNLDEKTLRDKGFTLQPDGSWAKRPRAVGAAPHPIRKPDSASALDRGGSIRKGSTGRLVVGIISFRHRTVDGDNLIGGAKPLRDAIAESCGLDDGDRRITWEYSQCHTTGPEGVIVCIATL